MRDLANVIKELEFFKERSLEDIAAIDVVNCMTLLHMRKGSEACRFGEVGHNFYFILMGTV